MSEKTVQLEIAKITYEYRGITIHMDGDCNINDIEIANLAPDTVYDNKKRVITLHSDDVYRMNSVINAFLMGLNQRKK